MCFWNIAFVFVFVICRQGNHAPNSTFMVYFLDIFQNITLWARFQKYLLRDERVCMAEREMWLLFHFCSVFQWVPIWISHVTSIRDSTVLILPSDNIVCSKTEFNYDINLLRTWPHYLQHACQRQAYNKDLTSSDSHQQINSNVFTSHFSLCPRSINKGREQVKTWEWGASLFCPFQFSIRWLSCTSFYISPFLYSYTTVSVTC